MAVKAVVTSSLERAGVTGGGLRPHQDEAATPTRVPFVKGQHSGTVNCKNVVSAHSRDLKIHAYVFHLILLATVFRFDTQLTAIPLGLFLLSVDSSSQFPTHRHYRTEKQISPDRWLWNLINVCVLMCGYLASFLIYNRFVEQKRMQQLRFFVDLLHFPLL
jgi:hypothetical protein